MDEGCTIHPAWGRAASCSCLSLCEGFPSEFTGLASIPCDRPQKGVWLLEHTVMSE